MGEIDIRGSRRRCRSALRPKARPRLAPLNVAPSAEGALEGSAHTASLQGEQTPPRTTTTISANIVRTKPPVNDANISQTKTVAPPRAWT